MTFQDKKILSAICSVIANLEEKQVCGTITFEESAQLIRLIEQAESILN
jgi:hypothetical protein